MDIVFMNYKNSGTSEPHRLLLNLTDLKEKKLEKGGKYPAVSNLIIYYTLRNIKRSYNNNEFKISASALNYLVEHILDQIFKITLYIT